MQTNMYRQTLQHLHPGTKACISSQQTSSSSKSIGALTGVGYRSLTGWFSALLKLAFLFVLHYAVGMWGLVILHEKFTRCKDAGWIKWVLHINEILSRSASLCYGDCRYSSAQGCNMPCASLRPLRSWPQFSCLVLLSLHGQRNYICISAASTVDCFSPIFLQHLLIPRWWCNHLDEKWASDLTRGLSEKQKQRTLLRSGPNLSKHAFSFVKNRLGSIKRAGRKEIL